MLRLEDIKKNYYVGDMTVEALKGINLCFRKSEFVSILGPSGCGKTTMLNIIGGLDQYTSGDLVINGRSTKEFNDHDWDVYRNHRIGFIFQSYNLIPHQTVLGNVELALTIAGLPKNERIERAKRALDRVGLSNQYYKHPNQMSGGQCQRVAIARALVNEPEILLADEPTGALDTETSVQIMELIKEISKEKLVIMVTHNPDLAYKYSTRIVKCLDGNVIEDSSSFTKEEEIAELESLKEEKLQSFDGIKEQSEKERAKMSLWTAFKLSARNLRSKFKRTFMVALAGCIGIVGVSTVLAVSNGVQNYIDDMENDMLSGNPVYISSSSLDYSSLMSGGLYADKEDVNKEQDRSKIFVNSLVRTLYNMNGVTSTNEITQKYMDFLEDMPEDTCALMKYDYGYKIAPNIYTDFLTSDGNKRKMSVAAIQAYYASVLNNVEEFKDYSSMISSVTVMTEAPSDAKYIESQYEVLYIEDGMTLEDVFNDESSLIAVASKGSNTLNDLELAEYGFFNQDQFLNYCYRVGNSNLYDKDGMDLPESISYEKLASKKFTWYPNDTVYTSGENDETYGPKYYASAYADGSMANEKNSDYEKFKRDAFSSDNSIDLNVKCVVRLKDDLSYGCLSSGGLYYTKKLSDHARKNNLDSNISRDCKENNGYLNNVEMAYYFTFDSNSSTTIEKTSLSSGSSIMSYISQFFGGSSETAVSSYSSSAIGADEFPTTIYFYCNDFEQKNLLTAYLDKWNNDNAENLYKVDKNGYYSSVVKNADGTETKTYYYYNTDLETYYQVNMNEDGYIQDVKGNVYKLIVDEDNKNSGFYKKLSDKLSDSFSIDGQLEIMNGYSINVMSLANYILLGDKFESSNIYYDYLEQATTKDGKNYGGYLYRYLNADDEYEYVMKVQNQSYYKLSLDKNGYIMAVNNGYGKYRYVAATYDENGNKLTNEAFYKDEYVLDEATGQYTLKSLEVCKENRYDSLTKKYYKNEKVYDSVTDKMVNSTEEVAAEVISDLFADSDVYSYANVVSNPTYTFNDTEYTLLTNGLYVDMTNVDMNNLSVDMDTNKISFSDYSGIDFYWKDESDNEYTYYYVTVEERTKGAVTSLYLLASDASSYLANYNLGDYNVGDYITDRYVLNTDGTLQAESDAFAENATSFTDLRKLKAIGDELTDLSILEIDDSLKMEYTDMIGLIISMVNTLIQVITYALIAFTALSLVVSTVMIGIITYVSVVERTKEIGVIRALGGRKKDVSHLFNAEALIIGFSAGLLGIIITYLLSILINVIIGHYAGIYTIASLPWYQAIIMILISVLLTSISGLIPASSAAKKDPVIALRTE